MTRLERVLKNFNPRQETESSILDTFSEIAKVVFYDGYFSVNRTTRIYPTEIEFYLFDEKDKSCKWRRDEKMIHKGNKEEVPYFPFCSFYPHTFGVDVTFENEKEEYRASFLIREYQYEKGGKTITSPTYLWEDLFGYNSFSGRGLRIKWIDKPGKDRSTPLKGQRKNLKDSEGKPDKKKWRFTKV